MHKGMGFAPFLTSQGEKLKLRLERREEGVEAPKAKEAQVTGPKSTEAAWISGSSGDEEDEATP